MRSPWKLRDMWPFQCHHRPTQRRISWTEVLRGVDIVQQTETLTNFRTALRYWLFWGYSRGVSPLGLVNRLQKLRSKLPIFNVCQFFCGQDNLLVGNFGQWAGWFTQLSCYLPPVSQDMDGDMELNKINAFATSCYRVMLNITLHGALAMFWTSPSIPWLTLWLGTASWNF